MCVPLVYRWTVVRCSLQPCYSVTFVAKHFSTSSASERAFERGSERTLTTLYSINLLVDDIDTMRVILQ